MMLDLGGQAHTIDASWQSHISQRWEEVWSLIIITVSAAAPGIEAVILAKLQ